VAQIGIKLADGSFFPVLDDTTPGRKRVVLTVAEEGQPTVQVDLLRESDEGTRQYVGCLVLEDLPAEGVNELELIVGVDDNETVNAEIHDTDRQQYQSISVSLDKLQQLESFDLPEEESIDIESVDTMEDLSLGDLSVDDVGLPDIGDEDFDDGFDEDAIETVDDLGDESGALTPGEELSIEEEYPADEDAVEPTREPRPFYLVSVVALVIIVVSLVLLGAYGVFRWLQTEPLPALRAASVPLLALPLRRFWSRR